MRPGEMTANFGSFTVTYCVDMDDDYFCLLARASLLKKSEKFAEIEIVERPDIPLENIRAEYVMLLRGKS